MNTRVAAEFVALCDHGVTRPFVIRDDGGAQWVLKGPLVDRPNKRLVNELVAGRMAAWIGAPWPRVDVMQMSEDVYQRARDAGVPLTGRDAVALEYVRDLTPVAAPPGGYSVGGDGAHILAIWPSPGEHAPFFAKNVFDNWAQLEDTKGDTLYKTALGRPFFLDASHALGGEGWSSGPWRWEEAEIGPRFGYLEGIVDRASPHKPFVERLRRFEEEDAARCVSGIPDSWAVPVERLDGLRDHLSRTATDFVPPFERWLDWLEAMGRI